MEAGRLNNNIAFVVQARMKSDRLPGKVLLPLPFESNKPLLKWVIEALQESEFDKQIIIATSRNAENDILEDFAIKSNVSCFRGDEDDVLSRFVAILEHEKYHACVRLTADNPIVDVKILDNAINYHLEHDNDYTKTSGLPLGMNFEIIKPEALLDTAKRTNEKSDKEHVTLFIRNSDQYKKAVFNYPKGYESLRLTVDYPSDYTLLSTLLAKTAKHPELRGMELVKNLYESNPWIFDSNQSNFQKKQYSSINDEIKDACMILKQYDLNQVVSLLNEGVK